MDNPSPEQRGAGEPETADKAAQPAIQERGQPASRSRRQIDGAALADDTDAQKRRIRALREEIGVLQDSRRPGWGAFDERTSTPRCIPFCPICDKPALPMPLTDYLRNGGPICCGVQTRLTR